MALRRHFCLNAWRVTCFTVFVSSALAGIGFTVSFFKLKDSSELRVHHPPAKQNTSGPSSTPRCVDVERGVCDVSSLVRAESVASDKRTDLTESEKAMSGQFTVR